MVTVQCWSVASGLLLDDPEHIFWTYNIIVIDKSSEVMASYQKKLEGKTIKHLFIAWEGVYL